MNKDKMEEAARRAVLLQQEENKNRSNDNTDNIDNAEYVETTKLNKEVIVDNDDVEPGYKSLGKANSAKNIKRDESEEVQRIKTQMGYTELVLQNLPSAGRFYPFGMKILMKAATVNEIKDFSTLEETNLYDIDDKLNNILVACCRVEMQGKLGSYKDILEEDRIYVILSIRELTFKQGENKLVLPAICSQCTHENKFEMKTNNLQYNDKDNTVEKYYSENDRLYYIPTKSVGTLKMAPPTIGVMKEITSYIRKKEEKKEKWDKSFLQVIPYLVKDWRGFSEKEIFDRHVEFQGWSTKKYSLIYRLADMMKLGVKQEFIERCERCEGEVTVPITFQGGLKSLFIISDPTDELL